MKKNKINAELLAPAGNQDALRAAIINGADAVYLGLNAFSARAQAQNFSFAQLQEAINYAHIFGVKIYLAINTLLKDSEVIGAIEAAKTAWDMGVSAIIAQDLGFVVALKSAYPQIVVHASTQMGVHNLLGARAAKNLGIDRAILSRETPLSEIKNISSNCDIELEYFVHGALCCSFSGNCYLSSIVSGKSGNRGKCLQLCRKPYLMGEKGEQGFWLSTRDTMLANHLSELKEAGICSFKIEGRMRRPQYVAEATRIYKAAMEQSITSSDIQALKLMFNRGDFSKAHINGFDSSIIYPHLQSHMGIGLGKVKSTQNNKAILDCFVHKGDGIKFLRANKESGHALVLADGFKSGFVGDVRAGDEVRLTDSAQANEQILSRTKRLQVAINAEFSLQKKSCNATISHQNSTMTAAYDINLQSPKNAPVSQSDIAQCLTSLGNTHFECTRLTTTADSDFFATKSDLKAIKRQLIDDFKQHLLAGFVRDDAKNVPTPLFGQLKPLKTPDNCTIVMCDVADISTFEPLADFVAIKPSNYAQLFADIKSKKFPSNKSAHILDLPAICLNSDINLLQEIIKTAAFDKFIVNNIYGIELAGRHQILLGYKMNMLNNVIDFPKIASIEGMQAIGAASTFAYTLGNPDLMQTAKQSHSDAFAYTLGNPDLMQTAKQNHSDAFAYTLGNPDLMQTVHCYYKQRYGCASCAQTAPITLTDNKGQSYTIKKQKLSNCYNLIVPNTPFKSESSGKKRFFDATSLSPSDKNALISFLKGTAHTIITQSHLSPKKLD